MKIKKEELSDLLFWKYGKFTGEGKRAREYIKKIKETELELSTDDFFKLIEKMLNYVWGERTEEDIDEDEVDTEEETEEETEEDTEDEVEETRKFVYDFFFKW